MIRYASGMTLALLTIAAFAPPVQAQSAEAPSAQGDLAVTIYNSGRSLVSDTRPIALSAGRQRIEFPDVSARIEPATATLSEQGVGAGQGIGIVEQNFDFDLLTPAKMMEKAVGRIVTIVRTNPATGAETREQAKVLAANGGVVLQIGQRIEVLRDDGLPVRVIFDKVPENLRARPTLSVTVESTGAGTRALGLSYLTQGLGWGADYVALFDRTAGKIDVQGWITLTNSTGTTFTNANTLLVAGQVEGGVSYAPPVRRAGTQTAARERIGDFYLYPLKQRTTIANAQTKQVSFLDVAGAPARAAYEYRNDWLGGGGEAQSASSVLKFSTSREAGLGDALPAGTVRVYMRDARGAPQFVGENRIGHTPMGSELSIVTGAAFDVKVKPVVVSREKAGDTKWRTAMRYTLTNASPEPVTVEVIQSGLDWAWAETRVITETVKGDRTSADSIRWSVAVPANGETEISALLETRY
ncbi:DUF4139 domain-containing protein [Sphingobium sufflavum]|uniref:DUF4139 domain-containing protein n=1 Tax=Sphingobium sufflavum TaxID=1129547 RepID=UPI001F367B81|nr:DUF4139 domain-containing protein [Sphingobium sufflavum]MCE7795294.1 DUF4139 domain-containing protein [Sphingobium sufflavum]